jgi:hypothetical protein
MTTTQWLALEVLVGLVMFLRCRDAALRVAGAGMALVALLYLLGGMPS